MADDVIDGEALDDYERRLNMAFDAAVERERRIDACGGSSEEISEARASADAYGMALQWFVQMREKRGRG